MVERVEIRNFKRFDALDCTLAKHLVVVGPNDCGKTTLFQAIAFWSEIASYWARENPDLARDTNGDYRVARLNVLRVSSILLEDWDHLWTHKNVTSPASIRIQIDGELLGFEIIYGEREVVSIRPMRNVSEAVLERYLVDPMIPIYIPPMSGVDREEPDYHGQTVIPGRLSRAQAGSVLRNMLLDVSTDSNKWNELNRVVANLFGYRLLMPSAGTEVFARYREGSSKEALGYSSASSGFLQVLMLYATILWRNHSIILIDEPDAHLHTFLQEKVYRDLKERAQHGGWQLIIATHSQHLINRVAPRDIRVLTEGLDKISNQRLLVKSLQLDNLDTVLARQKKCILYLEGWTDKEILRSWAKVLKHPLYRFLEELLCRRTAEDSWRSEEHFQTMRTNVSALKGVELRDRNNKGREVRGKQYPKGLKLLVWKRYEIENYLLHPAAILRWLTQRGDTVEVDKARDYMDDYFPPAFHRNPFEVDYFDIMKGKHVLNRICEAAQIRVDSTKYYGIAAGMKREEIHPEVIEKLDMMAKHFGIVNDNNTQAV